MWGIDPSHVLALAGKDGWLTGMPECPSGFPSTPCCQVWSQVGRPSHQSSYLRRYIREAAFWGAAPVRSPGQLSWGSAGGHWAPFSCVRCFCVF